MHFLQYLDSHWWASGTVPCPHCCWPFCWRRPPSAGVARAARLAGRISTLRCTAPTQGSGSTFQKHNHTRITNKLIYPSLGFAQWSVTFQVVNSLMERSKRTEKNYYLTSWRWTWRRATSHCYPRCRAPQPASTRCPWYAALPVAGRRCRTERPASGAPAPARNCVAGTGPVSPNPSCNWRENWVLILGNNVLKLHAEWKKFNPRQTVQCVLIKTNIR